MSPDELNTTVDQVLYTTVDPLVIIDDRPVPALTTLLHCVCGGDSRKYAEAIRIAGLFIAKALGNA